MLRILQGIESHFLSFYGALLNKMSGTVFKKATLDQELWSLYSWGRTCSEAQWQYPCGWWRSAAFHCTLSCKTNLPLRSARSHLLLGSTSSEGEDCLLRGELKLVSISDGSWGWKHIVWNAGMLKKCHETTVQIWLSNAEFSWKEFITKSTQTSLAATWGLAHKGDRGRGNTKKRL